MKLVEIRKIQLEILKVVTDYCDNHELTYFLGYGTLLGAIRHKGYIPWDDDIDILMPRLDYEWLIREFKDSDYDIKSHYKDRDYPYKFAKVSHEKSILKENTDLKYNLGINIDIFPLDVFPNSSTKIKNVYDEIRFLDRILKIKSISINPKRKLYKNIILRIGKILLKPISYNKIISKINNKSIQYNSLDNFSHMGCLVDTYGINDIMNKSVFDNRIELDFEGYKFYGPEKYDEYLTNIYGDYMQVPSKENRKTHHDFKAFRL